MNFDHERLFELAQELDAQARQMGNGRASGGREAKFRAAISRAYYAAFWCGRRYFETATPPQTLPRHNPHLELQDLFGRYPSQFMRDIAFNLEQLHKLRNRADYNSTLPDIEDESARALRIANRLLNDIGNLPSEPSAAS
jgi:hypothetical protein